MINLFIDTNIYLSFFHLTSEDLEELKKLVVLIDKGEIALFVPEQVRDEFARNRGAKIADAMRKFQEAKFNLSFPLFAKDYSQYNELRELMKSADKVHAELREKIMSDATGEALSADKIVGALFEKAKKIPITEEIYLEALMRVRLGRPPGKESSMGDAINWECLLRNVPDKEAINLVSEDKDFRSQLSDGAVNEYLESEWTTKKHSGLWFYSKLSDFFKDEFPNIKIASEIERDLLIQKLAGSKSFATTHLLTAKLVDQPEFSPTQVEQLVEIPELNGQVGMIVGDADVHNFYKMLLQKYAGKITVDAATTLAKIVADGEPAPEASR